jgi:hypothetical protein
MDESPVKEGVLWVGTDDGKVWITQTGGDEWNEVTGNIPGHPGYWVSRVEPSSTFEGTAYVTVTGYRNDDYRPFVWKTTDFGETWVSISANLPEDPLCVIREHPDNPELLFVGSTKQVLMSIDGGKNWNPIRNNMPFCPVEDLKIHPRENDLIVATHARSIWIADISYLPGLSDEVLNSSFKVFKPKTTVKWAGGLSSASPSNNFDGRSAAPGTPVYYYVDGNQDDLKLQIVDGARVIYEVDAETSKGVHKLQWNYSTIIRERTESEKNRLKQNIERFRAFGLTDAMIAERFGNLDYILGQVGPGNYKVRLVSGDKVCEQDFTVMKDYWK